MYTLPSWWKEAKPQTMIHIPSVMSTQWPKDNGQLVLIMSALLPSYAGSVPQGRNSRVGAPAFPVGPVDLLSHQVFLLNCTRRWSLCSQFWIPQVQQSPETWGETSCTNSLLCYWNFFVNKVVHAHCWNNKYYSPAYTKDHGLLPSLSSGLLTPTSASKEQSFLCFF